MRMLDVREVYDMVTKQKSADPGALERQRTRQIRTMRNRRIGAFAVVACVVALAAVAFALTGDRADRRTVGSGTDRSPTEPPLGPTILALDGTVLERIPGLPADAFALEMSPDGRTVAFITDDRVATIAADGTRLRILTTDLNNSFGDAHDAIAWSPDGTQLAYASNDDIYVMDADGSNPRRLTTARNGDYFPAWSAQDVIAYWNGATTGEDGGPMDSEIYTVPAAGGRPTRLTDNGVSNIEPTWSPDGEQIAFWNDGELFVMAADGSDVRMLYAGEGGAWAPTWSPDGAHIAFLSYDPSDRSLDDRPLLRVLVLDLATEKITDIGMRVESDLNGPSWTPDGNILINRYD
jgi:Tol biopolymer transport system component